MSGRRGRGEAARNGDITQINVRNVFFTYVPMCFDVCTAPHLFHTNPLLSFPSPLIGITVTIVSTLMYIKCRVTPEGGKRKSTV